MNRQFYEIWPLIVPAGESSKIFIKPKFKHASWERNKLTKINYIRDDSADFSGLCPKWNTYDEIKDFKISNGTLILEVFFDGENEHSFKLIGENKFEKEAELLNFNIFSAKPDLFKLRPFKGDIHLHSFYSDGNQSPAYIAASCRKIGYDFIAITDHHLYEPSLEAIDFMKAYDADIACYPGEEVHTPQDSEANPHIINFGGNFSVNSLVRDQNNYEKAIEEYTSKMPETEFENSKTSLAFAEWAFDRIREAGGLSVYSHPYWRAHGRYLVNSELNELMYQRQKFDALEIVGGFTRKIMEANTLAISRWNQAQSNDRQIPVVGVSDAHSCHHDLFGWYFTIVFAENVGLDSLISAIKDSRSIAVEAVPGEFPRYYGDFRLLRYAHFLRREYWTQHDRLCHEEGEALLNCLAGENSAREKLTLMKGQVHKYQNKCWK